MRFADFIADENIAFRSEYVTEQINGVKLIIYVRKSIRPKGAFELANIKASQRGKGTFTAFLDKWEDKLPLMVELAHNPRLGPYLERRGWTFVERPGYFFHHNRLYGELLV